MANPNRGVSDRIRLHIIAMAKARAQLALDDYSNMVLEYDDPSYPFEPHNQRSIRDKSSHSVTNTKNSVFITVNAPAARLFEYGNVPRDGSRMIRAKTKGRLAITESGGLGVYRPVEVKPYDGRLALHRLVAKHFGLDYRF